MRHRTDSDEAVFVAPDGYAEGATHHAFLRWALVSHVILSTLTGAAAPPGTPSAFRPEPESGPQLRGTLLTSRSAGWLRQPAASGLAFIAATGTPLTVPKGSGRVLGRPSGAARHDARAPQCTITAAGTRHFQDVWRFVGTTEKAPVGT